jgi:oligopeptide transport system substrate-binding protein
MKGSIRVLVVAIALAMVAAACSSNSSSGGSSGGGDVAQGGTYSLVNCEPEHMVPHNDYESCGSQAFQGLWTRLVDFDPTTFVPVMAQAESITKSDDGLVYTIKIKSGWTFHNGDPVTAQSYVDAWNYTAYGPNGFILNSFFDKIEGYDAMNTDSPKVKELSGLKVLDETSFEVTLSNPFGLFEYTLGFDAFDPLPQAFFDDPKEFEKAPIGDGPYMMDGQWKHNDTINLQRYPDYAGTAAVADKVELPIYTGDAAWLDFQAGNVDIIFVGSDHLGEAKQQFPDTVSEQPSSTLLFLGLPMYDPKFQSKELRQALSLGVDRQAVMNAILVAEQPADDFAPPPVTGYRQGICTNCAYDPTTAKQLFDQSGWTGPMTLNFPGDDTTLQQAMEAVANQWRDNLGLDVKLNPINPNSYYDYTFGKKMTGPWWDGWVEDYPHLQDYLEPIYGTNGSYNVSGYQSKEFDKLLDQANQLDISQSLPIYQQADDMLLDEMPSIPWGYLGFNTVHSDNVDNVTKVPGLDLVDLAKVSVVNSGGA